jgi:hypothetical protein
MDINKVLLDLYRTVSGSHEPRDADWPVETQGQKLLQQYEKKYSPKGLRFSPQEVQKIMQYMRKQKASPNVQQEALDWIDQMVNL